MDTNKEKGKSQKRGIKTKNDACKYYFSMRLTAQENDILNDLIIKTGLKDKTRLIKKIIFEKEVKVVKVDSATMEYYIRLTHFYVQFQRIGNNYNQTVRAIKTNFGEKRALALLYKLERVTIELVVVTKEIIRLTEEFKSKWLQK